MGKISPPSPFPSSNCEGVQVAAPSATWNNCFSNYCGGKKIVSVEENGVFFFSFSFFSPSFTSRRERKPICLFGYIFGGFSPVVLPRGGRRDMDEFRIRNLGSEQLAGVGGTACHWLGGPTLTKRGGPHSMYPPCDVRNADALLYNRAVPSVSNFLPLPNDSSGKSASLLPSSLQRRRLRPRLHPRGPLACVF